ncbi:hypothetical protein JOF28_002116 [Leucobacter exalbidus]|uniref:DUF937 domain-containing protein n=1 Tax=Leucobacter exalbidus TaxID=662960 RepID=A0A940PSX0_9MICO|nr:DUF937 domain-containing protein [Leucobacter exalbidus]MBP1326884.1 hypothetical protein [Leucobacter exalbidus]
MANESELNALLNQIPLGDLAAKFGVDEATVNAAVRQTLPGLVGGMAVNASDEAGAEKLQAAVQKHTPASGKLNLAAIDTEDGQKIVKHVLGEKKDDVALALGAKAGDSAIADLIPKLLPLLAPLVMQFLAGKIGGGAASGSGSASGGLGGVLGDLLGGLDSGAQGKDSEGGLGDLLGGLLGGGNGKSSGGGLGGLLGGLFGK